MKILFATLLLLLAACSAPDYEFTRTVHVSAERLAEIKSKPYVKVGRSGGGPAARLAGLGDDLWPSGILFLEYGPYLRELGFRKKQMLVEINGDGVEDIFFDRWKARPLKRPSAFHADHYDDLIRYLFAGKSGDQIAVKMYVNVPSRDNEIVNYVPEVEYWQIVLDK